MRVVNPVIRGFAPDPSIIRVGEWYYVATSSFEWFPSIPVYRSRDLALWEHAGAVDTAVPGGTLHGVPDSGGIWAPALSFSDGVFWVVYSIVRAVSRRYFDLETYVATAPDVAGPWSPPKRLPGYGFDPSLFHHEGRHYLLNLQNDSRVGGRRFAGIVLTELEVPLVAGRPDVDRIGPLGPTRFLLQREELVEGPKITAHDGWFYLLLAQGGTGLAHGVLVARSRSVTGPYEVDSRPLLTTRDDASVRLQKAGHGELVQTPGGQWFLGHLASRPLQTPDGLRCTLGRETAIQPITWTDGWPRLAHGGWHPADEVLVPDVPDRPDVPDVPDRPGPAAASSTGAGLSTRWPWRTLREPAGDWVDTESRPGWVRLRGRMSAESLWQQSLLARPLTEHHAQVRVVLDAAPRTFTQSAGLVLWYNTTSYYQLHLTWAEPEGAEQAGQQWSEPARGRRVLVLEHGHPEGARTLATVEVPDGALTLSADVAGAAAQFFWAPMAGDRAPIGPSVDMSELSDDFGPVLRFTGAFAGVSAMDLVDGTWYADFSGWQLLQERDEAGGRLRTTAPVDLPTCSG